MRISTFVLGGVATLFSASIALAADAQLPPVTDWTQLPMWGDMALGGGVLGLTDNSCSSCAASGSFLVGEGRVGGLIAPRFFGQVDFKGEHAYEHGSDTDDEGNNFGAALHVGMPFGGGDYLGLMASTGSAMDSNQWVTGAVEGVYNLSNSFRVVGQIGYQQDNESNSATYYHANLQYLLSDSFMLSGNVGYVRPSSDEGWENVYRYGAKAEYALTDSISSWVEWQGQHRIEANSSSDYQDNNRVMVGVTFRLNNGGSLFNASPLHDLNWKYGENNFFEY